MRDISCLLAGGCLRLRLSESNMRVAVIPFIDFMAAALSSMCRRGKTKPNQSKQNKANGEV